MSPFWKKPPEKPGEYRFDPSVVSDQKHLIYDYCLQQMPDAVTVKVPATLSPKTAKHLPRLSQTVCKILDLRDLVRLDYRLTSEGQLYFIEANALPSLEPGATTVHASAALAGLVATMEAVLDAVIKSAVERYGILVVRAFPKPAKGPEGWSSHSISSASSPWMQIDYDREAEFDKPGHDRFHHQRHFIPRP